MTYTPIAEPFLTDVTTLRERARQSIGKGAVTVRRLCASTELGAGRCGGGDAAGCTVDFDLGNRRVPHRNVIGEL